MDEPILAQRPTDERAEILSIEWLFGPAWHGDRLVARVADADVRLTDIDGRPAERPEVESLLRRAVSADRAVIDGVWTTSGPVADAGPAVERATFVPLDLPELEGESLFDIPFQERRRLLESVIDESPAVLVGQLVKQPLAGWLAGWRAAGFTHYFAWHQNARYIAGAQSADWLRIPIEQAANPGVLRRVIGGRPRTRRVR